MYRATVRQEEICKEAGWKLRSDPSIFKFEVPPSKNSDLRVGIGSVLEKLKLGVSIHEFRDPRGSIYIRKLELFVECYEIRAREDTRDVVWSVIIHRHMGDCAIVALQTLRTDSKSSKRIKTTIRKNLNHLKKILRKYYGDDIRGLIGFWEE